MDSDGVLQRAIKDALEDLNRTGGPLLPFTVVLVGRGDPREQELRVTRHVGERLEDCVAQAHASIDPVRPELVDVTVYAVVHDGYVTVDGTRWDAILVELGRADIPDAVTHAQRYQTVTSRLRRSHRVVAVGAPLLAHPRTSRLWAGDTVPDWRHPG